MQEKLISEKLVLGWFFTGVRVQCPLLRIVHYLVFLCLLSCFSLLRERSAYDSRCWLQGPHSQTLVSACQQNSVKLNLLLVKVFFFPSEYLPGQLVVAITIFYISFPTHTSQHGVSTTVLNLFLCLFYLKLLYLL